MRRAGVQLADHPHDLAKLIHQFGPVLQAAGGVDNQNIGIFGLGRRQRPVGQRRRIAAGRIGNHRGTGTRTPDLQLFDRRRAKCIPGGQHHLFPFGLPLLGQFTSCRGLARPIDPDQKHHMRAMCRINDQGFGHRCQNGFKAAGQGRGDRCRINRPIKFMRSHRLGEAACRGGTKIGRNQRILDIFKRRCIQLGFANQRRQRW